MGDGVSVGIDVCVGGIGVWVDGAGVGVEGSGVDVWSAMADGGDSVGCVQIRNKKTISRMIAMINLKRS